MAREKALRLLADVLRGRVRQLEPLMDLLLLPLGFHVLLLVLAASAPYPPACLAGFGGLLVVLVHLMAAIVTSGGGWRDAMALLASPCYILWKLFQIPLLVRSSRTNTAWIRTERRIRVDGQ